MALLQYEITFLDYYLIGSAIFDFQTCQFCPLKCPKTIKTERNMHNPHIQAVKEAALKAVN